MAFRLRSFGSEAQHFAVLTVAFAFCLSSQSAWALTENYQLSYADTAFYSFCLSAVVFSALIIAAYRAYAWLNYVLFAALMLLNIASMDGLIPHLLGSTDFALWVVPFLLYTGSSAFGFWLIGANLDSSHALYDLRRPMNILAGVSAALAISAPLWLMRIPLSSMWVPANALFFTMLFCQVLPPLTWRGLDVRLLRLIRAFPVVTGGFYAFFYSQHFLGGEFSQQELNKINRWGLCVFAGFSLGIVVWRAFISRQQQELAEQKALKAAQSEAKIQSELLESERLYRRAEAAAEQTKTQLATVSHDLKQPVAALRMALAHKAIDPQRADQLTRAVDYIGDLAATYVNEGQHAGLAPDKNEQLEKEKKNVTTTFLINSLVQMFLQDAHQARVELRSRAIEVDLTVDPLAAMRVMSNLLGNAIRHSEATRILVGFRPSAKGAVFVIYDDGIGMESDTLDDLKQPWTKSEKSAGQGLGLSIVDSLCKTQGFQLSIKTTLHRGTSITVEMPYVSDANNADDPERTTL